MAEFTIAVDVRFTRRYTFKAESAEQALEMYRRDLEAIGEPDDDMMSLDEMDATAEIELGY